MAVFRRLAKPDGGGATMAAWWFALMYRSNGKRAVRALRVLTEVVR